MKLQTRFGIRAQYRISILRNYSDSTAVFGAFCLLAILFELNNPQLRTFNEQFIEHIDTSPLKKIFSLWLGCCTDYNEINEIKSELDKIGFSSRQKEFIGNWTLKNIHFLRSKNESLRE